MEYLAGTALLAGQAVLIVEQILKLKIVPFSFANKYPVPTLIVLSLIAAGMTIGFTGVTWQNFVGSFVAIALVAAITYNQVLAKWAELREMEG